MKKEYKQAVLVAITGGKEILKVYNTDFEVEYKGDNSPLTLADQKANEAIVEKLKPLGIPMISEENKNKTFTERKNWSQCWIIDPLDGTKEFVKRNGEFTVNIALVKNQKPIFGVIYVPVTKELFVGLVKENKSYKLIWDDTKNFDDNFNDAKTLKPTESETMRVVGSRSHMNEDTQKFIEELKSNQNKPVEIVSKGDSLKFCLIAEGKADVYPRFAPTMEWDTAEVKPFVKLLDFELLIKKHNNLCFIIEKTYSTIISW
ncbi:3'(2'),5'-bisphosphate nucleotidase CysQ [Flavobacterium sp. CS20]|uniref:3'(2'),5'-bisphosphate nucleotidase CysQ family protein n=1 Tax=Flavobacterium sp. CS20 TaxID=2775246 RepID=UPI0035301DF7